MLAGYPSRDTRSLGLESSCFLPWFMRGDPGPTRKLQLQLQRISKPRTRGLFWT